MARPTYYMTTPIKTNAIMSIILFLLKAFKRLKTGIMSIS